MTMLRNKYHTVFDFGCSITMYRWVTWSDLIALGVSVERFYKTSLPGGGLRYVYQQLAHVSRNYNLSESDLVLICLPTVDRKDVCNTNDYDQDYHMASWSGKGSINLFEHPATSMSQGHHGEPRINIADMFMENLCYLEQILKLYQNLSCDKLLIHSDPWGYDPVEYLTHNYHYTEHLSAYNDIALDQLMTIAHRLRDQYHDTLAQMSDIISYEEYIIQSHAERSTDSDSLKFVEMDPHPTPDQAYDFVKKHFLNTNHCDIIDSIFDEIMLNFTSTRARTLQQSDYGHAHLQTCDPWYISDNYYYDSTWLFATPEQKQNRIPADICKSFNWPNLTMQEIINDQG